MFILEGKVNWNCPCAKHEDRGTANRILTHDIDGGERVASYTAAILPGAGREGPRGRLLRRTEYLFNPPRNLSTNPRLSSPSPRHYTD